MVEIIEIDGDFVAAGRLASEEGRKAFRDGKPQSSNPYEGRDAYLALQWGRAWCRENYNAAI